ncbi:MAG: hypothetical protein IPM53_20225 [Anaerolineaceae bacterium]|nr:hypothetical protein [Anaerolineaceae bacterium]
MNDDIFENTAVPRQSSWRHFLLLAGAFGLTLALILARAPAKTESLANRGAGPGQPAPAAGTPIEINLPEQHQLPVSWGDLGPRLVAAGAIDAERFIQLYADGGRPLTAAQQELLFTASHEPIVIDYQNSRFVLNFFWALGLVNQNPILTEGPMVQQSDGDIGRFASTGGWTLGHHPATELYASAPLVSLTPEQQTRLEKVVYHVYRPCCNNHTAFPDCNHGMAMLGLLELLASQDATVAEMFAAAKAVNGFWFPQQVVETAVFFKATLNLDYADVDSRVATGPEVFSGRGYGQVRLWLVANDLLGQPQDGGSSCGT